jgi:hypothetical protein
MRKLLKVLLPPLVGFAAYYIVITFSSSYFALSINEMGEETITVFMAYYRFFLPLLFTIAVLTQLLIVVPVWDRVLLRSVAGKFFSLLILCLICVAFAAGISYIIWDPASGADHLTSVCSFMTAVQLIYWGVNLLVLYFLTSKPAPPTEITDSTE